VESSPEGRCGEIASDILIILVTLANLIFFAFFHEYIAWYITEPDGSITRLAMLTDDYFAWLPFPMVASIIVIVATTVMIFYDNRWFRQVAWIVFPIMGIAVTLSLVSIFPFDFSVIPDTTVANFVPKLVTVFFVLMAVFYGISALVMLVRLRSYGAKQETK